MFIFCLACVSTNGGSVIYAHMCLHAPLMTGPGGGAHDKLLSIGDLHTATMMWVKMEIALFHHHYIS